MERVVGYGIDLNLQDSDGDTALHVVLANITMVDTLSDETPQLKKVYILIDAYFSNFSVAPVLMKIQMTKGFLPENFGTNLANVSTGCLGSSLGSQAKYRGLHH